MAKRKRLSVDPRPAPSEPAAAPPQAPLETKALFPTYRDGWAGETVRRRPAPIADVAGDASAAAALSEVSETLRSARESGRMVVELPLDQVEAGYLVRDRIATDEEEMQALVDSLRDRGQQTPIEVAPLGGERYGLISGWRRLRALGRLRDETGEPRFGTVLALIRQPDDSAQAYLAMVEENEIRVGLSYYERARIAAKAVEQGVYESEKKALQELFRAASRAKRSKIGTFLPVVRALDGALRFPEALGERAGLDLGRALEDDPALGQTLRARLETAPPRTAAEEQALLTEALPADAPAAPAAGAPAPDAAPADTTSPVRPAPAAKPAAETVEPAPGLRLRTHPDGSLTLSGPRLDPALRARLMEWLAGQGDA